MDKLREFLLPRAEPRVETVLDRAVREELKRTRSDESCLQFSAHRGTASVPVSRPRNSHTSPNRDARSPATLKWTGSRNQLPMVSKLQCPTGCYSLHMRDRSLLVASGISVNDTT